MQRLAGCSGLKLALNAADPTGAASIRRYSVTTFSSHQLFNNLPYDAMQLPIACAAVETCRQGVNTNPLRCQRAAASARMLSTGAAPLYLFWNNLKRLSRLFETVQYGTIDLLSSSAAV
jgi:hypothetical protein